MSITKKRMAHSGAPAILLTASGYTMNARPGPGRSNEKSHVNVVAKRAQFFVLLTNSYFTWTPKNKIEI